MKKVLLIFALLFVVVGGVVISQNYLTTNSFLSFKKNPTITINDRVFDLMVAASAQEKEIGLSETTSLPENKGMIFLFEKPDYHSFWMKNMKISIDIIYINGDEIITIYDNLHPPKNLQESLVIYTPTSPSNKVLEVTAGASEKYGLKVGDKVKIENL